MRTQFGKPKIFSVLQLLHVSTVVAAIIIIFLLHLHPSNLLDVLRFPAFLKDINPLLGFAWPASLHVYQFTLGFFLAVSLIDALGLVFYQSRTWRLFSDISSFLGFLIIWPVSLFFIFTLASAETLESQSIQTALVYFGLTFFLFILDLVTWFIDEQALLVRRLAKLHHLK